MAIGNIGHGYLLIDGKKIPVCVTEIHAAFDEAPEFRGHFYDLEYAHGGVIPVEKSPIKNVIFNDPATVVIWNDGSKTVVKCQPGDTYSKETGLALCIAKKYLGNKGNFNEVFKKWIPEETEPVEEVEISVEKMRDALYDYCYTKESCSKCPLDTPVCRCGCGTHFLTKRGDLYEMTDDEIRAAYEVAIEEA